MGLIENLLYKNLIMVVLKTVIVFINYNTENVISNWDL